MIDLEDFITMLAVAALIGIGSALAYDAIITPGPQQAQSMIGGYLLGTGLGIILVRWVFE